MLFKKHMRRVFEDIDAERTAEWELITLQQKRSTSVYAAQFQSIVFNVIWNNFLQAAWFYVELKDDVKDDIVREDWLLTLKDMISTVICINNWMYELYLEKRSINASIVVSKSSR